MMNARHAHASRDDRRRKDRNIRHQHDPKENKFYEVVLFLMNELSPVARMENLKVADFV